MVFLLFLSILGVITPSQLALSRSRKGASSRWCGLEYVVSVFSYVQCERQPAIRLAIPTIKYRRLIVSTTLGLETGLG